MPSRIMRVMKEDAGKPATGDGSATLGIRLKDIGLNEDVSATAQIEPDAGGMSVAGCLRTMLATLLPQKFEKIDPERFRGARANKNQKVWVRGDAPYKDSPVTDNLNLRIDDRSEPPGHGSVEPNRSMSLGAYRKALADTQDEWLEDETHPKDCPVCQRYGLQ